jgi:hypothetical protein
MATVDDLNEGLQLFRDYVEQNMPFKQTVYFGTFDPSVTPRPANIGAFFIRTNNTNPPTQVLNIYYKANVGSTDWALLGSGSAPSVAANSNTAGLDVQRVGSSTFALNLSLLNYDGTALNLNNPLILPFRNTETTNSLATFDLISFTSAETLTLNANHDLGLTHNVASKVFVYLGINQNDATDRTLVVSAQDRKDTSELVEVLDFDNGAASVNFFYSELGNSSNFGNYNLRLISVIDVTYSDSTGWGTPTKITPYSPELDQISYKSLDVSNTAGVSIRQQLTDLTKPNVTLKDFEQVYNNLCVQTYNEQNNLNNFSISENTSLSSNVFLQNFAIRVNPLDSGLVLTIPSISGQKTFFISNVSETESFTVSYLGDTLVIGSNETRHLNFCGTTTVTVPRIRFLDNKLIDKTYNTFGLRATLNEDDDLLEIEAIHPTGQDLSSSLFVDQDFKLLDVETGLAESSIQAIKFIQNLEINIPSATANILGLTSASVNNPERIYIYLYSNGSVNNLAVSGVSNLPENRVYTTATLNTSSLTKGVLYADNVVAGVSIKCIGYINYSVSNTQIVGLGVDTKLGSDEVLQSYYVEPFPENYAQVAKTDSTLTALQKLENQATWLKQSVSNLADIQNTKVLLPSYNEFTDIWSLELAPSSDEIGLVGGFGKRYSILDFASPTTVEINFTTSGLVVFEIVDDTVTLTLGGQHSTVLAGPNKKYIVWVTTETNDAIAGSRIRIISEYPVPVTQSDIKNFKTVDTETVSYNAEVNDAFLIGDTDDNFAFNLPNDVARGSKIHFYFGMVDTSYGAIYSINVTSPTTYYQTSDTSITVNNGGFCLEFEYNLFGSDYYWFVTSKDYNHVISGGIA